MKINITKMLVIMGEKGLTVSNLANLSGISRQTITCIKTGKTCSHITAGKIAKALDIPLMELIE